MNREENKEIISRFENFIDNLEEYEINEDIDMEEYESIKREVEHFWSNKTYKMVDLMNLIFITDVIEKTNIKQIEYIFNVCKLKIYPKEKKKGKRQSLIKRIYRHYHRKQIRNNLDMIMETLLRKEIQRLKEEDITDGVLKEYVNKLGLLPVIWICTKILKDESLHKQIKESFPERYTACLVEAAIFYLKVDYETLMENPERLNSDSLHKRKYQQIKKDNKKMKLKLNKIEKETSQLKLELYTAKQEKKKTEADLHDFYYSALKEIERLKEEKKEMQEFFLNEIERLNKEITELQDSPKASHSINLQNKTIAVIGGSKVRHFREIIEKYNGKIEFVSENDYLKIEGAIQKADAVLFLKDVLGHHFFRTAYPLAKKKNIPFVFLNSIGISTFERELQKITDKLLQKAS